MLRQLCPSLFLFLSFSPYGTISVSADTHSLSADKITDYSSSSPAEEEWEVCPSAAAATSEEPYSSMRHINRRDSSVVKIISLTD